MKNAEVVTYNAVLSACEKGREYLAAERVMDELDRWVGGVSVRHRLNPCYHLLPCTFTMKIQTRNM